MSPRQDANRRLLRARDAMDRGYAGPLDIATLARVSLMSPAHFIREFKLAFGESPHRYLQRRRIERAMTLLRHSVRPVTDVAFDVGFASLGTFSRTFTGIVGVPPSEFRRRSAPLRVPGCAVMSWTRPTSLIEPSSLIEPRSPMATGGPTVPVSPTDQSNFGEALAGGNP